MSEQMNTALVETALHMALQTRHPEATLLHYSDQGSQNTSADYQSSLVAANIQLSMSRVGNCYDNAVAESFFGTLKAGCVTGQYATHALARTTIFEYIEVWYNRQRLHSTHGYLSPAEFKQQPGYSLYPLNWDKFIPICASRDQPNCPHALFYQSSNGMRRKVVLDSFFCLR